MHVVNAAEGRSAFPPVVTPEQWQRARDALLVKEESPTRALDALAAPRRRLTVVGFSAGCGFGGPQGSVGLCPQLVVGRGLDLNVLDHTPFGRPEDSPAGWPQTPAYRWWRVQDEYPPEDGRVPG